MVICPTNLDHILPMVCLERQTALIATCWTENHRTQLKAKILKALWAAFLNEKSTHYQPSLLLGGFLFAVGFQWVCCGFVGVVPTKIVWELGDSCLEIWWVLSF